MRPTIRCEGAGDGNDLPRIMLPSAGRLRAARAGDGTAVRPPFVTPTNAKVSTIPSSNSVASTLLV
jgi:hypothetical protein